MLRTVLILGLFLLAFHPTLAQTEEVTHTLDSVTVVGKRHTSHLRQHGGTYMIDMQMMETMPKIMGNADPIRLLQLTPAVQANNDYDAGLHIQGCDNGHNHLSIDGIPVYNAGHLLGIFSTFNPLHFKSITTSCSPDGAGSPNRLGGTIVVTPHDSIVTRTQGQLAVGPMSSQGSISFPLSSISTLTFSARISYLNLLYRPWLKLEGNDFRYSFYDVNATYLLQPSPKDHIAAHFYAGNDEITATDPFLQAQFTLNWSNTLFGVIWKHRWNRRAALRQTLYATHYDNNLNIGQDRLRLNLPARIESYGYTAEMSMGKTAIGIEFIAHDITPQSPAVKSSYLHLESLERQHAQEASTYISASIGKEPLWADVGLRGVLFFNRHRHGAIDPDITIYWQPNPQGTISLYLYGRHQYLFQTGISSMGLPVEFWVASSKNIPPQSIRGISLKYETSSRRGYRLYAELFYKRLYGQMEYTGDLFDLLSAEYDLSKYIVQGKGENYAINTTISKNTGCLTGWLSYAYTHARRTINDDYFKGTYPSSHERPHELTAVAAYHPGKKWEIGATFIFASGTAFTAPSSFFYINGNMVSSFGAYNRNRLPAYSRLDVSANYTLRKKRNTEMGANISFYNILNRKNALYYKLHVDNDRFIYDRLAAIGILPSINLFYKF